MSHDPKIQTRVRVLLSIHRALLGAITPSLRGIAVSWNESRISGRFIYDKGHHDPELMQVAETEVDADFYDIMDTEFVMEIAAAPAPLELKNDEEWVYLRHED